MLLTFRLWVVATELCGYTSTRLSDLQENGFVYKIETILNIALTLLKHWAKQIELVYGLQLSTSDFHHGAALGLSFDFEPIPCVTWSLVTWGLSKPFPHFG